MDAEVCIRERRSTRKFTGDPIPHDVLEKIVELARFAPSWKNSQVVRYHVFENAEMKSRIADQCVMGFTFNAKTIERSAALVVMSVVENISGYEEDGSFTTPKGDRWEMFDAGIAAQTFCLSAHIHGVATVIMGIFDETVTKEVCGLPENEKVVAMIAAGYQEGPVKEAPPRKGVDELLFINE